MTREEAIKWLKNIKKDIGYPRHEALWHYEQALDETIEVLEQEPRKGEWVRNDNGTYSCSICHAWIPEEQHYYARYCLYCGADMRRETE